MTDKRQTIELAITLTLDNDEIAAIRADFAKVTAEGAVERSTDYDVISAWAGHVIERAAARAMLIAVASPDAKKD